MEDRNKAEGTYVELTEIRKGMESFTEVPPRVVTTADPATVAAAPVDYDE